MRVHQIFTTGRSGELPGDRGDAWWGGPRSRSRSSFCFEKLNSSCSLYSVELSHFFASGFETYRFE
jgi:hypothetical protein